MFSLWVISRVDITCPFKRTIPRQTGGNLCISFTFLLLRVFQRESVPPLEAAEHKGPPGLWVVGKQTGEEIEGSSSSSGDGNAAGKNREQTLQHISEAVKSRRASQGNICFHFLAFTQPFYSLTQQS